MQTLTVDLVQLEPAGTPRPGDTVKFGFALGGQPFPIGQADIVTCEVANNRPAEITITKAVDTLDPANSGDFDFTATSPLPLLPGSSLPATFSLDGVTEATPVSETFTVEPGEYTVTETNQEPDWELTGIQCSGGSVTTDVPAGTATITAAPGEEIECTYNNREIPDPVLDVTKTANPTQFQEPNGEVTYTVNIGNANGATDPITITNISETVAINGLPNPPALVDLTRRGTICCSWRHPHGQQL